MCNLFTTKATGAEVASAFKARKPAELNAGPGDVYPGAPALVVREDEGERIVQQMTWGFPRAMKSKKTGLPIKPVPMNNIANLDGWPWRFITGNPRHRCLIPLSGFCEAEGEKGAKTRTWFSLSDQEIFAWAGLWDISAEWGAVFSGLMTDCNDFVRPVHDRMPVLLHAHEYDQWLHGSPDDVRAFQDRCFPDALMAIERTAEPWLRRTAAPATSV
jgi:putative SOS response-associated peptidase YedK